MRKRRERAVYSVVAVTGKQRKTHLVESIMLTAHVLYSCSQAVHSKRRHCVTARHTRRCRWNMQFIRVR